MESEAGGERGGRLEGGWGRGGGLGELVGAFAHPHSFSLKRGETVPGSLGADGG